VADKAHFEFEPSSLKPFFASECAPMALHRAAAENFRPC
jgi:hypothetical protein